LSGTGVTVTGPTLAVSATSVALGGPVQVTVSDGPGNRADWVALAKVGSSLTSYVNWQYLSGTRTQPPEGLISVVLSFVMPQTLGEYEFRFFENGGYTLLATSPVVTVEPPVLTVSKALVEPGESVQVTMTNGPGNRTDWVALAAVGAPLTSYLDWQYLSGTRSAPPEGLSSAELTFAMPQTPGEYEFRFFSNSSYTLLVTSPTVIVEN
jgi:hypothetical protein